MITTLTLIDDGLIQASITGTHSEIRELTNELDGNIKYKLFNNSIFFKKEDKQKFVNITIHFSIIKYNKK